MSDNSRVYKIVPSTQVRKKVQTAIEQYLNEYPIWAEKLEDTPVTNGDMAQLIAEHLKSQILMFKKPQAVIKEAHDKLKNRAGQKTE